MALLLALCHMCASGPSDYVNLLAGSFTKGDQFSTGNTMPLVGRPWGFNHFSLQTNSGDSAWWFSGNDHEFRWLRCTHMPSPWIGDYAFFLFGPQMGDFVNNPVGFFEPRAATLRPYAMDFTTAPDGMRIRLAPSMHCAMLSVEFPRERKKKRVCFSRLVETQQTSSNEIRSVARHNSGGAPRLGLRVRIVHSGRFVDHRGGFFCVEYDETSTKVELRLSTSFISHDQAEENERAELDGNSYEDLLKESRDEWDSLLSRVKVEPRQTAKGQDYLSVFYTCLYRALTFPRRIDEGGRHYSPYSHLDETKPGVLVTDNGFWDTFRTVYPLLSLAYPDHLAKIIEGWVNAYKEGGWIPKWASPGYRNSMVGTYGDVVVADALVKNIVDSGVRNDALAAIRKDAEVIPPTGGAVGRVGLAQYQQHHYIPYDSGVSDSVSRTLDFAFADFAIANAFQAEDPLFSKTLRDRSRDAMRHLFDGETGLMRPKSSVGAFKRSFSTTRWGDGYTEGSAWHHSFPPFDIDLLSSLHGGPTKLCEKLKEMIETPSTFEPGGYGTTIHEMREMRALAMGQYGHNNQPSHHALYLFALAGDLNSTSRHVRAVVDRAYGRDFFAGDEDNGEMGAWFVLSAIGLFAPAPGASDDYVASPPLFDKVVLDVPGRHPLTITRSQSHSPDETDVVAVYLNDTRINGPSIRYGALAKGGHLYFQMARSSSVPPLPREENVVVSKTAPPLTQTPPPVFVPPRRMSRLRPPLPVEADAAETPPCRETQPSTDRNNNATVGVVALCVVGFLLGRISSGSVCKRRNLNWKKPNSHVV